MIQEVLYQKLFKKIKFATFFLLAISTLFKILSVLNTFAVVNTSGIFHENPLINYKFLDGIGLTAARVKEVCNRGVACSLLKLDGS